MDSKEELTGRLWVGPGLPEATLGYKRQSSHFVDERVGWFSSTVLGVLFLLNQSFVVFVKV